MGILSAGKIATMVRTSECSAVDSRGRRMTDIDRRALTAGLVGFALSAASIRLARAQQLEKPSIRLGVANKAHLYYLPLTLAERRGHFRDYALNVTITDFEGG